MTDQIVVQEEQDQYDLKTDQGYYIKSRSFIGSSTWMMGAEVIVLAEYLIAKAAHTRWKSFCEFQKKEVWVNRGEVKKSQRGENGMIAEIGVLTEKQFRTAWAKLKRSGFFQDLTPKCVNGARSYKHIRICKYEGYQNQENYKGHVRGTLGAREGQQYKNEKNDKQEKNKEGDAPKKARSRRPSAPPPLQIQVFHETTGRYPNKILWPHVIKAIGEHTAPEVTPFYEAWILRSYNPTNLGWLFEWFVSGTIPAGKNGADASVYRTGQEGTWVKGDDAF